MEFKVVSVDVREANEWKKSENGFVPLIVKTLDTYAADMNYEKDKGRAWSRRRNAAMKAAILASSECAAVFGDKVVGNYTRTCSCGCSGILPVERLGKEVFIELEQIA